MTSNCFTARWTKSCFRTAFRLSFGPFGLSQNFMPGYVSKLMARTGKHFKVFVLVVFCTLAAFTSGSAQVAKKATDKAVEPRPAPRRRERPRVRPPVANTAPATVESDRFLDLGNSFRQDGKWNAAEAAYKEAVSVWSGNADALLELGFLYIDRNRLPEAQSMYNKLRGVDSSAAADLLADINRYKQSIR